MFAMTTQVFLSFSVVLQVGPTVDRGWMGAEELGIEERILVSKIYRG
jgi:hypothetical protein